MAVIKGSKKYDVIEKMRTVSVVPFALILECIPWRNVR